MDRRRARIPIIPMREEPSEKSEMVSQILFGEEFEILEEVQNWVQVRTSYDAYTGFVDQGQVPEDSEFDRLFSEGSQTLSARQSLEIDLGHSSVRVWRGSEIPGVLIPEGVDIVGGQLDAVEVAKTFLGVSYLWGGRSGAGCDCSGLVQVVLKSLGLSFPRDTSKQILEGTEVEFSDRKKGDLAFFTKDGRINHVGILSSPESIIHASSWVREDDFNEKGILRRLDGVQSHNLETIHRVL